MLTPVRICLGSSAPAYSTAALLQEARTLVPVAESSAPATATARRAQRPIWSTEPAAHHDCARCKFFTSEHDVDAPHPASEQHVAQRQHV